VLFKPGVLVSSHNIGIAVDSPSGLVVPNIKGLQNLSVLEVAAELARLSEAARNNSLKPADLEGGTITLSNVGAIGGTYTSPILMPGEACIGAMGAIERIPRYDAEGNLAPTMVMRMSWSGDHRLLAGATLARFSNRFKALLSDPSLMLLALR
jgi:2-oxoisovalerate dehydrogenase E2 component (dihydrolipoyl transacylase)